jgi:hypothetical protein
VQPIKKFVFLTEIGFDDELIDEPFAKLNYIHPLPKLVKGHVKKMTITKLLSNFSKICDVAK